MKRLFFLLALAIVAAGAMAQGPQGSRGRHNDRHGHGDSHRRPPMEQRYYDCASAEQMQAVMDALNGQSFDDKKLEIAKLCVTIGYFCTADMAQMATVFSFDDKRLEFLKYAYPYCLDKENYPTLRESFSFKSNFDALLDYIYPNLRK